MLDNVSSPKLFLLENNLPQHGLEQGRGGSYSYNLVNICKTISNLLILQPGSVSQGLPCNLSPVIYMLCLAFNIPSPESQDGLFSLFKSFYFKTCPFTPQPTIPMGFPSAEQEPRLCAVQPPQHTATLSFPPEPAVFLESTKGNA